MCKIVPILRDTRTIQSIFSDQEGGIAWDIDWRDIDEIRAYAESGSAAWVHYYAIIKDDQIVMRIPGHMVVVTYVQKKEETEEE